MNITNTTNILPYDMCHIYFFKNQMEEEEEEGRYIRGIYIKSNWEPPLASKEVKCKLDKFKKRLTTLNKSHSRYVASNLTLTQHHICGDIRNSQTHQAWLSNKKLVPVWCETEIYTKLGVLYHLGNNTTYNQMIDNMMKICIVKLKYACESFITRNRLELSDAERT